HFLGSVADKVIRLAPSPVLVVHEEPGPLASGPPILATDLSRCSAAALPLARALADATGTTLELLHVHEARLSATVSTDALEARVRAFARDHLGAATAPCATKVLVTGGSVQDALVEYLASQPASVVVLSTVGGEPTEHHLLGRAPSRLARE